MIILFCSWIQSEQLLTRNPLYYYWFVYTLKCNTVRSVVSDFRSGVHNERRRRSKEHKAPTHSKIAACVTKNKNRSGRHNRIVCVHVHAGEATIKKTWQGLTTAAFQVTVLVYHRILSCHCELNTYSHFSDGSVACYCLEHWKYMEERIFLSTDIYGMLPYFRLHQLTSPSDHINFAQESWAYCRLNTTLALWLVVVWRRCYV